ncbi:MAG: class I SAM-dependent methyltransferase [Clostridiales Family XIII bacterium]|nr:class I SAM-dependent methyltransferase [Clostridiales Family XIII bacterium]
MIDKYRLFRQASEFTGFHKKLGVIIEPYLNRRWTMADIGCGLALLDFHLLSNVKSVTAIDIDESALTEVENHIDEELAANHAEAAKIATLRKDVSELVDERWDIVLMSFFGKSPEEIGGILSRADHRGVVVMHGHERGGLFDPVRFDRPRITVDEMERYLSDEGYGYRKSIVDLQFGQPFRTIEDIHRFLGDKIVKGHSVLPETGEAPDDIGDTETGAGVFDIDRLVYSAEERIIKTKRYDFPYYLPRNLHTAVFIVVTRR